MILIKILHFSSNLKNQRLAIFVGLLLVVSVTGVWHLDVVQRKKIREQRQSSVDDKVVSNSRSEMDSRKKEEGTAAFKEYKNEEYKYAFEYPSDWSLTDHYNDPVPGEGNKIRGFRYVSMETPDGLFGVEIGVKNQNENEWVFAHSWYTGIPAGNFFRGDQIKVGEGTAEKQILVYDPMNVSGFDQTKIFQPADSLQTRLVFYCQPTQDKKIDGCNDFSIGNGKVARAEIHDLTHDSPTESQWTDIQDQTEEVLKSLQFMPT